MVRKATKSVQVCVEFNGHAPADAYFEDMKTQTIQGAID